MNKMLPGQSHGVAKSRARRSAMIGAAATALIAVAPALHAATPELQSAKLQAAVRNALRVPVSERMSVEAVRKAFGTPASLAAVSRKIDFGNDQDITVGADQSAIQLSSDQESVSVVNSGDLTGGIGIDVATGANDFSNPLFDQSVTNVYNINYAPLFDDVGNPVYTCSPYFCTQYVPTAELTVERRDTILARDPLDSKISIDNSGSIAFAGRHGIRTVNPAGESIDIVNSGDIVSTQDTASRSGIYASTETFRQTTGEVTQTAEGDLTYNANGQLTGVNAPDEYSVDYQSVDMEYDGGSIAIHNSGDIDMGVVAPPLDPYAPRLRLSVGIYSKGDGGTTIVNEGDIKVDKWSSGIHVSSTATTSISNSGRIDIGNGSSGISLAPSQGDAGDYRLGGDIYILNSGDIRGGVEAAEAGPGQPAYASGISISTRGSNNEFLAGYAHLNELYASYNELLGSEQFALVDIPKTRLYSTTALNTGHIELKDGGRGVFINQDAGDSTAINEGTIIVGDGSSSATVYSYNPAQSMGILQNNSPGGVSSTTSVNTATGVIVTGDDSFGIAHFNLGGDSIVINEGSITTGNGVVRRSGGYDIALQSVGILSAAQSSLAPGTTSYAYNSGDITVGEIAVGMFVSGQGARLLAETAAEFTAININEGIISTGDNSSGMFTMGTNATTRNSGSVTIGDYDLSAYQPHPVIRAHVFRQLRYGVASSGEALSEVINDGLITTGNGAIGASAGMYYAGYGFAARLLQGEDGVIATGDGAIGARVAGNYYASLENQGGIAVGDDSVGIDMSAGSVVLRRYELAATVIEGVVVAANDGIVETGDNSIGVRLNAVLEDVPYTGTAIEFDPPGCSPYYPPCTYTIVNVAGTADSIGSAYLMNGGRISVGADSTAVEITGEAAGPQGLHLFNTGTIAAGSGTAIRLNAGNDLDSYVVNVGEIAGDIVFGAGDDRLMNTQFVDNFGQLVSTGNITLNGSTIDFGAGLNRFDNDRGIITITGGDSLITGADLFMTDASIEARNGIAGSRLTIDGNLSGNFTFGADLGSTSVDQLTITGDVADGSAMNLVLNPTEQFGGENQFAVIKIEGENGASAPVVSGVTGRFADSLLDAKTSFNDSTGEVVVTALFGMGHLATAAASTTTMAQNWWMQSVGSFDKRNMQRQAGASDSDNGLSVWGAFFHQEGTITPDNDLQDVGFDQQVSGLQTGIEWTQDFAGGSVSVSPILSIGDASANMNANLASASGDAVAYGLNASYVFKNGLYLDATWQSMSMSVDLKAPGTAANARGDTDADGDGFNIEAGYAYKLKSGLTLAPQLQYGSVDVELDNFTSSDDTYALSGMGGKSSLLRAGLGVFKTFETPNGSVTPLANFDYLYESEGDSTLQSNGIAFSSDTSGAGYRAEFGIAGRYKAWVITGRVGLADMSTSDYALSTNVSVRYRW